MRFCARSHLSFRYVDQEMGNTMHTINRPRFATAVLATQLAVLGTVGIGIATAPEANAAANCNGTINYN